MQINFSKMHGCGNDFVVIDAIHQDIAFTSELIQRLADRHFGIGCDQVLVLEAADDDSVDFTYRIFNADGNEVGQCGNGARCAALFALDKGLARQSPIHCQNTAGRLTLTTNGETVTVAMGLPEFEPAKIPMLAEYIAPEYSLPLSDKILQFSALSLGNPHAVIQVDDLEKTDVTHLAKAVQMSGLFPEGVNVGFMQVHSPQNISLRVYERGVGETLACGSGACAAVVAGIRLGHLTDPVDVQLVGGHVQVSWSEQQVHLTGPAVTVFEGTIEI